MSGWPDAIPRESNKKLETVESISNWFEIYKINEETFAIIEPYHYEEAISYLVIGKEKALLFDTGMGVVSIKQEVEKLTKNEIIVLNSHSHYDHAGGNHEFNDVWAFDNNWEINRIEKGDFSQKRFINFDEGNYSIELPEGFEKDNYHIKPSKVTKRIKHLDRIELGDREILVFHTPGHSPASICLQDFKYKLLFTGDTLYPGEIYLDLEGSDPETYFKSIEYLNGLFDRVHFLCPGHNEARISVDYLLKFQKACEQVKGEVAQGNKNKNLKFENFNISF